MQNGAGVAAIENRLKKGEIAKRLGIKKSRVKKSQCDLTFFQSVIWNHASSNHVNQ
jgi:hypothetical protein